ncbi:acyltransferase family protein [Syntrophomonas erecta subsp. sporosyntropha]
MSGYLFRKYPTFSTFIKSKIKSLLFPYVSFTFLSVILIAIINNHGLALVGVLKAFILSERNCIPYNQPLWFLTCLFLVQVFYYVAKRSISNNYTILLALILIGLISPSVLESLNLDRLPWSLDFAFYYIIFFAIGNLVAKTKINIKPVYRKVIFYIAVIINLLVLVYPDFLQIILLAQISNVVVNYFRNILIACSGIATFVFIAMKMQNSKKLSYLGINSLIILALHLPLSYRFIERLLRVFKLNEYVVQDSVIGILFTVVSIIILLPCIQIINNYYPSLIGKNKL